MSTSIFQPFTARTTTTHGRSLYSQQFINFNCNATQFGGEAGIQLTMVDDTVGTYATNYAILAIGLLGVFLFSCVRDPLVSNYKRFAFLSGYFGCTGLGYGVAGVNHQIRSVETDPKFYFVAYIFTVLGAISLQLQIGMNFKVGGGTNPKYWCNLLCLIIGFAVLVVIAGWGMVILTGGYLSVSNLWFVVYYAMIKDWLASVGSVIIIAGFAVQFFLAPTCGDSGYDDCFRDCIMRDPMTFNHNALFHLLVILGMILQLFARFVPMEALSSLSSEEPAVEETRQQDDKELIDEGDVEPNA